MSCWASRICFAGLARPARPSPSRCLPSYLGLAWMSSRIWLGWMATTHGNSPPGTSLARHRRASTSAAAAGCPNDRGTVRWAASAPGRRRDRKSSTRPSWPRSARPKRRWQWSSRPLRSRCVPPPSWHRGLRCNSSRPPSAWHLPSSRPRSSRHLPSSRVPRLGCCRHRRRVPPMPQREVYPRVQVRHGTSMAASLRRGGCSTRTTRRSKRGVGSSS